jgi:hypothetical protein
MEKNVDKKLISTAKNTCKEIYCENLETAQYSAFKEIVDNLMPDIVKPENPEQAVELFKNIVNAIEEYI